MSQPYEAHPSLAELSVSELTQTFRRVTRQSLQEGMDPDKLLSEVEGVLAKEQYELAQAIVDEVAAFRKKPQLSLFARIFS